MKNLVYLFFILAYLMASCGHSINHDKIISSIKSGDIIFQVSESRQSQAIQIATNSIYSHMGMVYNKNDEWFVYEAIQPVKLTPLFDWINRGKDNHFVVKRLKNYDEVIDNEALKELEKAGLRYLSSDYDLYFEWSDERIYCSELVWKMYKNALNIEIGKTQNLSVFDLDNEIVKRKIEERFGKDIPYDEPVISPSSLYNSNKLKTIISN